MKSHCLKPFVRFLLILITAISPQAFGEKVTVRSDLWCPYACEPSSPKPGYMVEVVRLILSKHGHTIDYKLMNWVDAIKETRANKANALIGCSRADAPDFIFPEKPLGMMINHYFVNKTSTWSYKGRQSLEGKKIGVIKGYVYGDAVDNLVKTKHKSLVTVDGNDPLGKLIKMMEQGKLDAFVESPSVLRYSLAKHNKSLDQFKAVSANLANDPDLFIAFSPNNPRSAYYAELITKGIDEIRKSGELDKILERYSLVDWVKKNVLAWMSFGTLGPAQPNTSRSLHSIDRINPSI